MRLSADSRSPYYSRKAQYATVMLDGLLLDDCREASEEGGWALVFKRDANGKFVVCRDEIVLEKCKGKVVITIGPIPTRQSRNSKLKETPDAK